ncbi:hypothetical protein F3Y22_tig00012370pilonHSYRG00179 [Hibiscus syriacus]|uniref:DEK domain-containing chromatin associated protein n=1 Tax=Hibiscus syriacus TaxID=106335 RepID=A0A6A3C6P3_HIBSY|nr:hypothetical protein F3Y22_tig00012370pilonHSYRG00179 [Hibiscus syriacus]
MGEEETKTEVPDPVANGTPLPEKTVEVGREEEDNRVKEDKERKEVESEAKDEPKIDAMDEETGAKVDVKKLEEENKDEMDELNEDEEEKAENELKGEDEEEQEEKAEDKLKGEDEEEQEENAEDELKGEDEEEQEENSEESEEEKKEPEQRTPLTDRPVREQKSVERLVASIEKGSSREFQIEKGKGTHLKDIPNVAFKLSRQKTEDAFRLLHTVLFGRRGKFTHIPCPLQAAQIKSNISRFSGFVWHDNEEKQRSKVKEKLDKFNKEKLLEFCDVLDVPVMKAMKATTRKEDIITKLIDFLVVPHATTTVLLAEKEKSSKGTKRKRATKNGTTSKRSTKGRFLFPFIKGNKHVGRRVQSILQSSSSSSQP